MFLKTIRGLFTRNLVGVLWDNDGAAATAAGPAGSGSGSAATGDGSAAPAGAGDGSAASAAAAAAAAGGGNGGRGQAAPAARSGFTYTEDRSRWVPPHRIVEETTRRTRLEADLEAANKRIQALAGVTPTDPNLVEAEKIREAFFALPNMAHFRNLTPEMVTRLVAVADHGDELRQTTENYWDRHADSTFSKLGKAVADHIGIDKLSDRQQQRLNAGFIAMLRSDPRTYRPRYEAGDETLLTEFVKEWADDFFEPARRTETARVLNRRPIVPRGGSSAPVVQGAPQIDYLDPVAVENEAVRRMQEAGHLRER